MKPKQAHCQGAASRAEQRRTAQAQNGLMFGLVGTGKVATNRKAKLSVA